MIYNYLDFAKRQRLFALKESLRSLRAVRETDDSWTKGFYQGLNMVYYYEARNWRKLQKDIEDRDAQGMTLQAVGRRVPERQIKLS